MKTVAIYILLGVFIVLIAFQLYRLNERVIALRAEERELHERVSTLQANNEKLYKDIEYYANTRNLMKEFLSLFDYKRQGEDLYIIVPGTVREEVSKSAL
ncbi:MAG: hypothetical protein COU08_00705 [Candidatus Harrisonbacteria bacterium CG10_big_fil_rev_8_21_14_0_10_42_17]|uniref:Septum formation initiator n=1 Tax=Candidatus Harrisonbacteria bacterium CG10_big_fil_rev_8_21_14_0_10_42_17 TaxID=1974584 RepID=A0A2M6WJ06_9BACT|nr:MAG: hypothetical protein COU08_00705 [Candidatus Harrisonbacteria bacterium CG10_big_fil_rev_8_21_14_0_10_42_17]